MTFLQPLALWGLALAAIPIIIHLLNLLRHRSQPWAATRFLLEARRSSSKISSLRRWLTLFFRALALAALALVLSRPMTDGDSLFSFSAGAPEAFVLVLDRSASMEAHSGDQNASKRQRALEAFVKRVEPWKEESRFVLVDSALREPVVLNDPTLLTDPSMEHYVSPTDTAADLPATIETALDWLDENGIASAEILIASDMQRSNWLSDGGENAFARIRKALSGKEEGRRLRILPLDGEVPHNVKLAGEKLLRLPDKLDLRVRLRRQSTSGTDLRVRAVLEGNETQHSVPLSGETHLWRPNLPVNDEGQGWLSLHLPSDTSQGDNSWFFAYGDSGRPQAAVRTDLSATERPLRAAAHSSGKFASRLPSSAITAADLAGHSLLLLQGSPRSPEEAERLKNFVAKGGCLLAFPPTTDENRAPGLFEWSPIEQAEDEGKPFRAAFSWNEESGLLRNTTDGARLSFEDLAVSARRIPLNGKPLILFADGKPFLSRLPFGDGFAYAFSTLPAPDWSDMAEHDRPPHLFFIRRLLQSSAASRSGTASLFCGSAETDEAELVECLDSPVPKDPRLRAGVYRLDGLLAAVNRPPEEDDEATLPLDEGRKLLGEANVEALQTQEAENPWEQAEIWNLFLWVALLSLLGESLLGLPGAVRRQTKEAIA